MLSIPFSTGDIHGGFSEGRGAIHVDDDEVVIEVQVKVFGLFDRDAQSFRFELTDLEEIRHKRTPFSDKVTIRTRPMGLIGEVPGASEGALVLSFKRRHRDQVDALLDRLDLWLT